MSAKGGKLVKYKKKPSVYTGGRWGEKGIQLRRKLTEGDIRRMARLINLDYSQGNHVFHLAYTVQ